MMNHKMMEHEKIKTRSKMLGKCMELRLSYQLKSKMCDLFGNINESEKEALAQKILDILNSTSDEKIIEQKIDKIKNGCTM